MANAVAYSEDAVDNGVAQAMPTVAQQLFAPDAPAMVATATKERSSSNKHWLSLHSSQDKDKALANYANIK